jgi:cell division septum initiation protein DivIVA
VERVDVLYLLDQLEEVLGAGSRVPLTSRTLVDEPEILDIIDQIRLSIPEEIKAAKRLTEERDQMIADARAEADRILRDADAQVSERLGEHHLVRSAEARAADIQDRAIEQAAAIRREADAYAHRVLLKLRDQIAQVGTTVDRGIAELEARGAHEQVTDPV